MDISGSISTITDRAAATVGAGIDKMLSRGTYNAPRTTGYFAANGDQQLVIDLKNYHSSNNTAKLVSTLEDIRSSTPEQIKSILGRGVGEANNKAIKVFRQIIEDKANPEARAKALEIMFEYLKSDQAIIGFKQGCAIPKNQAAELLDQLHEYMSVPNDATARQAHASSLATSLGYHQTKLGQKVRVDVNNIDAGIIPYETDIAVGEMPLTKANGKFNFLQVLRRSGAAGASLYASLCPEGKDSGFYADNRKLLLSAVTADRDSSYNSPIVARNAYDQIRRELASAPFDSMDLNLVDPVTGETTQEYNLGTFVQDFVSHEPNSQERAVHNLIGAYYNIEAQKQDIQSSTLEISDIARSTLIKSINKKQVHMLQMIFGANGLASKGELGKALSDRAKYIASSTEAVNMAICTGADTLVDPNMDAQVHKFTSYFKKAFGTQLQVQELTTDSSTEPVSRDVKNIEDLVEARNQMDKTLKEHLSIVTNDIFEGTAVAGLMDSNDFHSLVNGLKDAATEATNRKEEATTEYNHDHSDITDIKRQCDNADRKDIDTNAPLSIQLNTNQAQYLGALLRRINASSWDKASKEEPGFEGKVFKAGEIELSKTQLLEIRKLIKANSSTGPKHTMLAKKDAARNATVLADYQTAVQTLLTSYEAANPDRAYKIDPSSIDFSDCLDIHDAQLRLSNEVIKPLADQGAGPEVHLKSGGHLEYLDSLTSKRDIINPEAGPLTKSEALILDIIREDDRAYQKASPIYVEGSETVAMDDSKADVLYENADFTTLTKYQPRRKTSNNKQGMISEFLQARDKSGTYFDAEKARFAGLEMLKRIGPSDDKVAVDARTMVYTKILGIEASQINDSGHLIIEGEGDKAFSQRITDTLGPTKFRVKSSGEITGAEYARVYSLKHRIDEIDENIPAMKEVADTQLFIDLSRFGKYAWDKQTIDRTAVIGGLQQIKDNLNTMRRTTDPAKLTALRTQNLELSGLSQTGLGGDHHDKFDDLIQRSHVIDYNRNPDIFSQIMQYINQLIDSLVAPAANSNSQVATRANNQITTTTA